MTHDHLTDARESMHRAKSLSAARCIITHVRSKLEDARFIGWPALVQSLKREHDEAQAIATGKGWTV